MQSSSETTRVSYSGRKTVAADPNRSTRSSSGSGASWKPPIVTFPSSTYQVGLTQPMDHREEYSPPKIAFSQRSKSQSSHDSGSKITISYHLHQQLPTDAPSLSAEPIRRSQSTPSEKTQSSSKPIDTIGSLPNPAPTIRFNQPLRSTRTSDARPCPYPPHLTIRFSYLRPHCLAVDRL